MRFFVAVPTMMFAGTVACSSSEATEVNLAACANFGALTIGTPVNGSLDNGDCNSGEGLTDRYKFTVGGQTTLALTVTGSIGGGLALQNLDRGEETGVVFEGSPTGKVAYAVVPAGNYGIEVWGGSTSAKGTYTVSVNSASIPEGCFAGQNGGGPELYVLGGVSISGNITTSDCGATYYNDHFLLHLVAGKFYQVTTSGSMGINVEFRSASSLLLAKNDPAGSVSFTQQANSTGMGSVGVIAIPQLKTGSYTVSITQLGGNQ